MLNNACEMNYDCCRLLFTRRFCSTSFPVAYKQRVVFPRCLPSRSFRRAEANPILWVWLCNISLPFFIMYKVHFYFVICVLLSQKCISAIPVKLSLSFVINSHGEHLWNEKPYFCWSLVWSQWIHCSVNELRPSKTSFKIFIITR